MNEVRCDDGGVMREVYKDPTWGQVNVRTIPPGATAGGHRHPRTNEEWYLLRGILRVTVEQKLYPPFERTLHRGDFIFIPRATGHLVENIGETEAVLVYWRDRLYDPDDPDKEPWDWHESP